MAKGVTYANRIVRLREFADISGREVARLAGISETHINQLESQSPDAVSARTLQRIAHVFGVPLDWLYTGAGKSPTKASVRRAVASSRKQHGSGSSRDSYT